MRIQHAPHAAPVRPAAAPPKSQAKAPLAASAASQPAATVQFSKAALQAAGKGDADHDGDAK